MTVTQASEPDLSGWLAGHQIMRRQFGLLAEAAGDVGPRDAERLEALESHLAFMLRRLSWHHWQEDHRIFPGLRERDDSLAGMLDDLETEHESLDAIMAAAGERQVPYHRRATALNELHRVLERHLDHEEADAVPAIRRLIPASVWQLGHEEFLQELGADRTLTMVWMLSHLPEGARGGMLAELPPAERARFVSILLPEHRRRVALLYGSER